LDIIGAAASTAPLIKSDRRLKLTIEQSLHMFFCPLFAVADKSKSDVFALLTRARFIPWWRMPARTVSPFRIQVMGHESQTLPERPKSAMAAASVVADHSACSILFGRAHCTPVLLWSDERISTRRAFRWQSGTATIARYSRSNVAMRETPASSFAQETPAPIVDGMQ
jgi:hypothetical protein